MTEWKADERFFGFLVKKFESDCGLKDLVGVTKPLVGAGQKEYSMNDLVDEMRRGTRIGRKLYTTLYGIHEREFKDDLVSGNASLEWTNKDEGFFRNITLESMGYRQYVVVYDCGEMGERGWHRRNYLFRASDDIAAKTLAVAFAKQMAERGDSLRIQYIHELRTECREVDVNSLETKVEEVEEASKRAINFEDVPDIY